MLINAASIILTLIVVILAAYVGLYFVRKFALQIAQENHDAIRAMDEADNADRLKKQQQADAAADSAFAKVLVQENTSSNNPEVV